MSKAGGASDVPGGVGAGARDSVPGEVGSGAVGCSDVTVGGGTEEDGLSGGDPGSGVFVDEGAS